MRLKELLILLVVGVGVAHPVFPLINTESLRRQDVSHGVYQTARFNFDYISGNSNTMQLKPLYRIDYFDTGWHGFIVSELRYGNEDGDTFLNQAFIHGRVMLPYRDDDTLEFFLQSEYDDFRRVTNRRVVGVNERRELVKSDAIDIAAAIGLLYEDETNTIEGRRDYLRVNSYISGRVIIDNLRINSTIYAQIKADQWADCRLLSETTLVSMIGSSNVGLNSTLKIAYDNLPPNGIKQLDLTLNSGIVLNF